MKRFDQIFTLDVNKSQEQIIDRAKQRGIVSLQGKTIIISKSPPFYKIFAARGTARLIVTREEDTRSVMQCILSPSLFDLRNTLIFLLLNVILWGALIYFSVGEVAMLVVFFIEWFIMAFVAIPLLVAIIALASIYMLSISFTLPTLFFIIVTWSFLYLLLNATVRFNRGELKKWVVRMFV